MKSEERILVCGGAGYIGGTFCQYLREKEIEPIIVDNLSKGRKEFVKDFEFFNYDIADYQLITDIIKKFNVKTVFHFSAFIEVGESVKFPLKYYENNTYKTISLLKACVDSKVKNFIFSSTAAVYGIPDEIPITENAKCNPINPYGRSKNMVENILIDLANQKLLNSVCLRYFNASGAIPSCLVGEAHNPETHIIPRILDVIIGKSDIFTVYGNDYPTPDGTCIRDYVHVIDLLDAHILAMEYLDDDGSTDIFNLGSEKGYSVMEIIKEVEKVTGKKVNYTFGKRREGDPPILVASSEKIKKVLGWKANYSLEEIIKTAYNWHLKLQNYNF